MANKNKGLAIAMIKDNKSNNEIQEKTGYSLSQINRFRKEVGEQAEDLMPTMPTPEQQRRRDFIDRVKQDFISKSVSEGQRDALAWTKTKIDNFRSAIKNTFDYANTKAHLAISEEYLCYTRSFRLVERWANTAIANDWQTGQEWEAGDAIENVYAYPHPEDADKNIERQNLCHFVTQECYKIAVQFAEFLPHGRALSLCMTELQIARDHLIDCVNNNVT